MNIMRSDNIQKLVDEIMKAGNLGGLPEAEEMAFRQSMEEQITRRLGLIIMQNLDEKGVEEYTKIMESEPIPSPETMKKFLEQHLPDYEEKIKQGMDIFLKEVLAAAIK